MTGSEERSAAGEGPEAEAGGAGSTTGGGAPMGAFEGRGHADAAGRSEEDGETWRSLGDVLQGFLAALLADSATAGDELARLGPRRVPVDRGVHRARYSADVADRAPESAGHGWPDRRGDCARPSGTSTTRGFIG